MRIEVLRFDMGCGQCQSVFFEMDLGCDRVKAELCNEGN
jgi:hypothetical protein